MRTRKTGRLLSVSEGPVGTTLAADAAAGATSITVDDASVFDESGGSLLIGSQTVAYTGYDDETGVVTLAAGLTAAADTDDPVLRWNTLYGEVDTAQLAEVAVEGDRDQGDTLVCEVSDSLDLPTGDRGGDGESCTIELDGDVWTVVHAHGRPSKTRGVKFEADDAYVLTAADVTAATVTLPLSHRPLDESLLAWHHFGGTAYAGVDQTDYTLDADAQTCTFPLGAGVAAGDVIRVRYPYQRGLLRNLLLPFGGSGWSYLQIATADTTDRSGVSFDDSSWSVGQAPFSDSLAAHPTGSGLGWLTPATTGFTLNASFWLRRHVVANPNNAVKITVRVDTYCTVYWNGTAVGTGGTDTSGSSAYVFTVPASDVLSSNTLAIRASDDSAGGIGDRSYVDVEVDGAS